MKKKRKKVAIALGAVAALVVLVNVLFGYIIAEPDTSAKKRCIYSLYRVAVALVEYCNVNDTTLTPQSLQVLTDSGILEGKWLRCSDFGSQFGYFGQFDLLGPRPSMILWCRSEHVEEEGGFPVTATYILNSEIRPLRCTPRYVENRLGHLEAVRGILAAGDTQEEIERLLETIAGDKPELRLFAVWRLGRMHLKRLESVFLEILDKDDEAVRYEAAEALALLSNPAGGAALLTRMRSSDYFERLRAFNSLRELAGGDFGFNPVLDAELQPDAMAAFDRWWAQTASSLRQDNAEETDPEEGK